MDKSDLLAKEAGKIRRCRECKKGKIGLAVPGEGNPCTKIVFVGEAPGREEAKVGRPFVGRSGQLLTQLLTKIGIKREKVFITSPVKFLPKRGTPTRADIAHGNSHLHKQIEIINPKIIVLLGNTAFTALIGQASSVNSRHGEIIKKDDRIYFVTFHPAAALRFPQVRKFFSQDLAKLAKIIPN